MRGSIQLELNNITQKSESLNSFPVYEILRKNEFIAC